MKPAANAPCLCGSGHKFKRCCRAIIRSKSAQSPEQLMRSRFVAYATGNAAYILDTTDPEGPIYEQDTAKWLTEVLAFSNSTVFEGLTILNTGFEGPEGHVTFRAQLSQGDVDASFSERSRFKKVNGRWFYHSGQAP